MNTVFAQNFSDLNHPSVVSGMGAFSEYLLPPSLANKISLGSTVIIEDWRDGERIWLSGDVIELKSISPFRADRDVMLYDRNHNSDAGSILNEINGPHSEQKIVAKVKIEIELNKDGSGNYVISPTQRPASNASKMTMPTIHPTDPSMPSVSDLLGLKTQGVNIGFVGVGSRPREENGEFLPYFLDIDNLDNRHMFIVGESGSGKTVLLKKLALGFRKNIIDGKSPRVIMTDVQGDLLQLMMGEMIKPIQRRDWQSRLPTENTNEALAEMGPFQLVLPYTKNGDRQIYASIKEIVAHNGHKVSEVGLRLQDIENVAEVEYLLRLSSEQAVTVLEDEIDAMKNAKIPITLDKLEGQLKKILASDGGEKQVKTSGGTQFYKSTFLAALRGLRHLRDIFDIHENSLLTNKNPLECLNFEGTSVFYLEHLDPEERLMWGMQLVKWLYENKRLEGHFFVFIDEAHQLIPQKPPAAGKNGTFQRLRDNFEKLAREGRKFGINLVLGTQSPRDLHEIVPQQCPTRIVMKIDKGNAKAAHIDEAEARIASRFSQGQMYLKSPFNGTSDWIRVHSQSPPLPHESLSNFWPRVKEEAIKINQQY